MTSASPAQGGSLSPLGATRHDIGSTVTITPQANPGWRFDHWQGDLTGNANPGSVLMDAEKSVTGVFVETRTLTTSASPAEGGSVSPAGTTQQDYGATVSVTATPAEGYRFSHWTGAISGSANPGSVTMNAVKSVTAVFIRQFSLTTDPSPPEGGSVSPAGTTVYDTGTSVSVSAQANTGWRFHHWEGDLSGTSSPSSVTMDADKSVTAVFVQQFTLTTEVSPAGGGSVTPTGTTIHDAGSNVTVDPEASSGWRFHHWEGAVSGTTEPADVIMDGNKQVTAVFIEQFELTINIQGSGTVAADPPNGPYDNGTDVTLTATPEPGWFLDRWEEDVTGSANPAIVHMDADKMVTAVFNRLAQLEAVVDFSGQGIVSFEPHVENIYSVIDPAPNTPRYPVFRDLVSLGWEARLTAVFETETDPTRGQWSQVTGPEASLVPVSGTASAMQNAMTGGIYQISYDYPESPALSNANVVLPLSGAEISSQVYNDLLMASAFGQLVAIAYYPLGPGISDFYRWFFYAGRGDHWGTPQGCLSVASRQNLALKYSPLEFNRQRGFGEGGIHDAIATWFGLPTDTAILNYMLVGRAMRATGVDQASIDLLVWSALAAANGNHDAKEYMYYVGADPNMDYVGQGAIYAQEAYDLSVLDSQVGPRIERLWPNGHGVANHVSRLDDDAQLYDYYFSSPGFLYITDPSLL